MKYQKAPGVKTTPENAEKFVKMTGIDLFAPSVGSIHGLIRQGKPHTDPELIAQIKKLQEYHWCFMGVQGLQMKILPMLQKLEFRWFI